MILLPAIDLYEKKAVRLLEGDYRKMTVYSDDPLSVAHDFAVQGAEWIHMVDLEGAREGTTPNLEVVAGIARNTSLSVEVGGGIRSMEVAGRYLEAGVARVILGTAAVTDEDFLREALRCYGDRIAVGVDLKDGYVAIKGWLETSAYTAEEFLGKMQKMGVRTVICTDISRDGAMRGTNLALYADLSRRYSLQLIASGGVSSLSDVRALAGMGLYGAIVGKAYYTGAISLREAIGVAK